MPQRCAVLGCKSPFRRSGGISFHCFPRDEGIRQQWLSSLPFGNLKWEQKPRVCSRHFKKEDFIFGGRNKLKKYAVPLLLSPSSSQANVQVLAEIDVVETRPATGAFPNTTGSEVHNTSGDHSSASPHISTIESQLSNEVPKIISMSCSSELAQGETVFQEGETCTMNIGTATPKVTKKQRQQALTEVSKVLETSNAINMSWIPEDQNEAKVCNALALATSTPKKRRTPLREATNPAVDEGKDHPNEKSCKQCSSHLTAIKVLEEEVAYLKKENERLQKFTKPKCFLSLDHCSENDQKILFYTGFQSFEILNLVFKWVLPSGNVSDMYIHSTSLTAPETRKVERTTKLSAENQFFLTLIRLRRGLSIETLGDLFGISKSCANDIFLSWTNLLYLRLGSLDIWPGRDVLIQRGSDGMREKYPNVIGSIDCTEFFIQRPSSLMKQSECYSNYKGTTTMKSLIMVDPAGAIIYASPLFTGSISDKALMENSGFIDILKEKVGTGQILPGDTILADKGFNVGDLFHDINLEINIPVFKLSHMQFTSEEVALNRKVAQERIHVERAIGRLKNYKILLSKISISTLCSIEQIYTVCVLLCNFRLGLIKGKTQK